MSGRFTVTIDSLAPTGHGVAQHPTEEGFSVHVEGAAPGDTVDVQPVHRSHQQKTVFCTVCNYIERGPESRSPVCIRSLQGGGRCGGCPLLHVIPEAQRATKEAWARDALGSLYDERLAIHTEGGELYYRGRGHFVAARSGDKVRLGAYAPRSHEVIRVDGCLVLKPPIDRVARYLERAADELGIPIGDEPGGLRYVTIAADDERRALVELVTRSGADWAKPLAERLMGQPSVLGVSASINDDPGNAMRGRQRRALTGEDSMCIQLGDLEVRADASSFVQLNRAVATEAYRMAAQWTEPFAIRVLWDLYCGVGGMGLHALAKHPDARLFGCESSEESVAVARTLVPSGRDARFECVDLKHGLPQDAPAPDAVFVNPPRRGLDAPVLDAIATSPARLCIYMSCHPVSFARDAARLVGTGWKLCALEGLDMLPQTAHIELLARFEREEHSARD